MKNLCRRNVSSKLILGCAILLSSLVASAAPEGARAVPRFLAEKLSTEQIQALEAQSDHEARIELLKSWGVEMPPPPEHRRAQDRLPPFLENKLTEEQKAQLLAVESREERRELLESWGIQMPPRRERPESR